MSSSTEFPVWLAASTPPLQQLWIDTPAEEREEILDSLSEKYAELEGTDEQGMAYLHLAELLEERGYGSKTATRWVWLWMDTREYRSEEEE